jgi:transposase
MPGPLSNDLRKRVVEAVENGDTYEDVAARFAVGRASVSRWWRRWRGTGNVDPKVSGGRKPALDMASTETLLSLVVAQPDATLMKLVELLVVKGIFTNRKAVSKTLVKMGFTRKKKASSTTDERTTM